MPRYPGDDKAKPSLELPSLKLPGFSRRRRDKPGETAGTTHAPLEEPRTPAVDEPAQSRGRQATRSSPVDGTGDHTDEPATPVIATEVPARSARRERTRPVLPGQPAAALTGLLVGAAGAAGTYGAMAACEAVRGVSSCGGAPGFFTLVAIVVLMVLLGAGLLKTFGVEDTVSTSFLAVGIVTVLVMLMLLDVIFSAWMFAVIPALTAAAYLLAHWVTTRFEGEDTGRRDWR